MAIYYLDAKVISRSTGRSAVAAAAYRSGEILFDERYEKEHDYSRKENIAHTEILLPDGAPLWMSNREELWNSVERFEKRKDAQLARELVIALPKELTIEQNILLIKEYVQSHFVDKGMIADMSLHNDKAIDGEPQPHAHVLLTLRELNLEKGEGEKEGKEMCFGKKVREWNLKENLLIWRESWAEIANKHLALNGHDRRIDHRRLEEQEIELTPGIKVGAAAAREHMAKLIEQQKVMYENGEKIYEDPEIALRALTRQQSTFTHHDLAKFVNRHSGDSEQFERIFEKVKLCSQIVHLGLDEQGRDRYTTQDMLDIEMKMIGHADRLSERAFGHRVREIKERDKGAEIEVRGEVAKDIEREIERELEVELETGGEGGREEKQKRLTEQQTAVYEYLIEEGDIKCVVGYAGSGKSHLLGAVREVLEEEGYRVLGATLSGIAAENLEKSSGIASRTLASRSYCWDKGEQLLDAKDILVIDEAGMVGSRQMERVLREVERGGAKVILVGDPQQLQAIEAGASFRALAERVGFIELTEIWRQKEEWQREATLSFANRDFAKGLGAYQENGCVHEFETQAFAKQAVVERWFEERESQSQISLSKDMGKDTYGVEDVENTENAKNRAQERGQERRLDNNRYKTQIMLSYTRKDVQELNEMARSLRKEIGDLREEHAVLTERGVRQFAVGERVYFLENERLNLDVKNGTLGTILKIEGKELTIRIDSNEKEQGEQKGQERGRVVIVDVERYNKLEYGYAATIHKAQGVTVDKSYVLASKHMDSHATYVGMSRHREKVEIYWSKEEFGYEQNLDKYLSRDRSKDVTLDYAKNYGIDATNGINDIKVNRMIVKKEVNLDKQARGEQKEVRELEKLKEITPIRKTKELGEKENQSESRTQEQSVNRNFDALEAFKKRYEQKHPERAQRHKEMVSPSIEKKMGKVVDKFRQLHKQLEQPEVGLDEKARVLLKKELSDYAYKMSKNEQLMDYAKRYEKDVFPEVKKLAQEKIREISKQKEKIRERSLEHELELER